LAFGIELGFERVKLCVNRGEAGVGRRDCTARCGDPRVEFARQRFRPRGRAGRITRGLGKAGSLGFGGVLVAQQRCRIGRRADQQQRNKGGEPPQRQAPLPNAAA
jgi:hypothetical protein